MELRSLEKLLLANFWQVKRRLELFESGDLGLEGHLLAIPSNKRVVTPLQKSIFKIIHDF